MYMNKMKYSATKKVAVKNNTVLPPSTPTAPLNTTETIDRLNIEAPQDTEVKDQPSKGKKGKKDKDGE